MAPRKSETDENPRIKPNLTWEGFQLVCETLAKTGAKYKSCETNGFSYSAVASAIMAQEQAGDDEWRQLWDLSYEKYKESLVIEARSRAVDGWNEPIFQGGKKVGSVTKKSDRLMELMLKAHVPEQFTPNVNVAATHTAGPGLDVLKGLSVAAKKQIRDIIIADLKAQKEALQAREQAAQDAVEVQGPSE